MKVALVLCPSWDSGFSTYAPASLAAGLAARGHEANIFDLNKVFALLDSCAKEGREERRSDLTSQWLENSFVRRKMEEHAGYLESFVDGVLSQGHRIVGFSVYVSNERMSIELARLFKRKDPGIVTVFGGSQYLKFRRCLDIIEKYDCVDAVVYGEGDIPFPGLVERLEKTGRLEAGPGVLLRNDPSTWKEGQERVSNLDSIPFADYKAHRLAPVRRKTINTARGCVRKCDFCSEWRQMNFRQRSAQRVHREIRHQLADHPEITEFMFGDSLVNGVPRGFELLCDLMVREPLGITWDGYAIVRPEMTRAVLDKARQSGCRGLFYGVESGSEKVRLRIGKNTPDALIASVLKDTAAAGIETGVGCIVGHPCENESDFERTLAFVAANADSISALSINLFGAGELDGWEESYGLIPITDALFWRTKDGSNTFPVRIERAKRLARATVACGIRVIFQDSDDRYDEMLDRYRRWCSRSSL